MDQSEIRDPAGGVNHTGIRDHNERLILSLIQRHGQLASVEIARRAGLSPQTVSVIIRGLEQEGLLLRCEPVRGKVGKPSVPMELNPNGALALGLKIGRRNSDLVLMDLCGGLREQLTVSYAYPAPETVLEFLEDGFKKIMDELTPEAKATMTGIGIAAPSEIWNWLDAVRAPKHELAQWESLDLGQEVSRRTGLETRVVNDATAACATEHILGRGREFSDYAYFHIGSFVGGGVVLNDAVYTGRSGNAGAFGSLPVQDIHNKEHQLIHRASIYRLERLLEGSGRDVDILAADWTGFDDCLVPWLEETSHYLAVASVAVTSVIDFEAVLIDGTFPAHIRTRLVEMVRAEVPRIDTQGITAPRIEAGTIGRNAKALGAAGLPIFSKFFVGPAGLPAPEMAEDAEGLGPQGQRE